MDFIYPYIKNTQVFVCPSGRVRAAGDPYYGYNRLVSNSTLTPRSLGDITRPAEIILSLDYATQYGTYANCDEFSRVFKPEANSCVMPHNEGTNVTFCDGHSKWLNGTDQAFADRVEATNRSWNPTLQ
jgi:prepilin-type processing-associated H-X9-DG protein